MKYRNKIFNKLLCKKAKEIIKLSISISCNFNCDLSKLTLSGKENPNIYFTGDIVQQSNSLFEEIVEAQNTTVFEKKYFHAKTSKWISYRLMENLKRLERCNSKAKDFLPLIKKELIKFNELYKHWTLTIL